MRLANFICDYSICSTVHVKARMRYQVVEAARKRAPFVSCMASQINTGAKHVFRQLAGESPRNPDPVQQSYADCRYQDYRLRQIHACQ